MPLKNIVFYFFFSFAFLFGKSQSWKSYADSAVSHVKKNNFDSAIQYYKKSLKQIESDSSFSFSRIKVNEGFADAYMKSFLFDSARYYCMEAQKNILAILGKPSEAFMMNATMLGRINFELGNYDEAEMAFTDAREVSLTINKVPGTYYAYTCNNLGNLYSSTGNFSKAEPLYIESLELRDKLLGKQHPDYAQSCNNLADLYRNTGLYEKAEPLAILAKEIRSKNPGKLSKAYAISCTNLANLYRDMGQYLKAEKLYIEAKQIRAEILTKKSPLYASSCNILADLYGLTGQYEKADSLYNEALKIREETLGKSHRDYAQTCNNLANIYCDMGLPEKAVSLAETANSIWKASLKTDDPAIAINENVLGNIYSVLGLTKKAEQSYQDARPILKKKFGIEHPHFIANSEGLARIYWNTGQPKKAGGLYKEIFNAQFSQQQKVFQFTNEEEKNQFVKNIKGSGDELYSFQYNACNHLNAGESFTMSLLNRNLILKAASQLRRLIFEKGDTSLIRDYDKWVSCKQQLATLNLQLNDSRTDQIEQISNVADSIEKSLFKRSEAFKKELSRPTWEKIKSRLRQNEAAIEFISFQDFNGKQWTDSIRFAALLIRKDFRNPIMVPLFEKNQLDSLLANKSAASIFSRGIKLIEKTEIKESLFKLIWKPLEKSLNNIETVYFSPTADLFKIPFAALPIDSLHLLSDKYKLIQLSSTEKIISPENYRVDSKSRLVLYGGIYYDADSSELVKLVSGYHKNDSTTRTSTDEVGIQQGFSYLPGTENEIRKIKNIADNKGFSTRSFSKLEASEESFKALSGSRSPSVIHIASHGFFFPDSASKLSKMKRSLKRGGSEFRYSDNPLFRSGLLFAGANNSWKGNKIAGIDDGILTAYEVSNMYLPDTRLVVLSACETALGDINGSEGVYGLQRAFKIAGVQNLIMSLWEVPDKETAEFMELLYKNLFEQRSVQDAFLLTQSKMKEKYRQDPYKWAAWILVK